MEDLVETGLDCIGPLDPLGGLAPAQVRSRIGDSVALMGGVNTLSFINGSPDSIIEESAECIAAAGANGGYLLGSGCVIPRNASKENVDALRIATERHGLYRDGRLCLSRDRCRASRY